MLSAAAAASARRGDHSEAHTALKAAGVCAAELNEERCDLGTVFGPTNVAIHQVAVAIELGDASEATRNIPKVDLHRMFSRFAERRARFLIDVPVTIRNSETMQRPWMRCCKQRLSRPMSSVTTGPPMKYCMAFCRASDARPSFVRWRIAASCCIRGASNTLACHSARSAPRRSTKNTALEYSLVA